MPFRSAIDQAIYFGKPETIHDLLKFCAPIGTNNDHHLIDAVAMLEPVNRMSNNRLVADHTQQFIEPHPLTATSRHNNRENHSRLSVSVVGSRLVVSFQLSAPSWGRCAS